MTTLSKITSRIDAMISVATLSTLAAAAFYAVSNFLSF